MKKVLQVLASDNNWFLNIRCQDFRRSYFPYLLALTGFLSSALAPGTLAYGATPASGPAASATSIIGKEATLNGVPLAPGATLFPGDVVRVGWDSTAALRFGDSLVLAAP